MRLHNHNCSLPFRLSVWLPVDSRLHTQLASDLRRIVPEWGVSLPTFWGVLVQWWGAYFGLTVGAVSTCGVQKVSWVTLSLWSRMSPA